MEIKKKLENFEESESEMGDIVLENFTQVREFLFHFVSKFDESIVELEIQEPVDVKEEEEGKAENPKKKVIEEKKEKGVDKKEKEECDGEEEEEEEILFTTHHVLGCSKCRKRKKLELKLYVCENCFDYMLCEECYEKYSKIENLVEKDKFHYNYHKFSILDNDKWYKSYKKGVLLFIESIDKDETIKFFRELLKNTENIKRKLKITSFLLCLMIKSNDFNTSYKDLMEGRKLFRQFDNLIKFKDEEYVSFCENLEWTFFSISMIIGRTSNDSKMYLKCLHLSYVLAKYMDSDLVDDVLDAYREKDEVFDNLIYFWNKGLIKKKMFEDMLETIAVDGNVQEVKSLFNEIVLNKKQ